MAKKYLNRAWMTTSTTGTGTITLGTAKSNDYLTFAEAGIANSDTANYVIIDGTDFEVGLGTYTSSGTTFSRDTVIVSKVGGTSGTSKLNLSGSATIFLTETASDAQAVYDLLVNLAANSVLARAASSAGAASGVALAASQVIGRGSSGDVAAIGLAPSALAMDTTTIRVVGSCTSFVNLKTFNNTTTPNSKMDITADEVVVKNSSGYAVCLSSVSETVDITVSGASGLDTGSEASSTWYYIYIIWDGTNVNALLSTSATAPTMPSGYTYKKLVGAVYNNGSSNFYTTKSFGNMVHISPVFALNGAGVTTLGSLSLTACVPAIAVRCGGNTYTISNINSGTLIAADSTPTYKRYYCLEAAGTITIDGFFPGMEWSMPLFTSQTIWRKNQNTSGGYIISVDWFGLPI